MAILFGELNPVAVCLVGGLKPHCTETQVCKVDPSGGREPDWYATATFDHRGCSGNKIYTDEYIHGLVDLKVVYAAAREARPLLLLQTRNLGGMDGNHDVQTVLYQYDRVRNRFRTVFVNDSGGSNNNQAARFVEHGPLQGDVIVDYPTDHAPYVYWIEVYAPAKSGRYARILRYRSSTHYGDGNPLPVADSEMPEIMERLGFWKPGDALPIPPRVPEGCGPLVLRHGEEWCKTLRIARSPQ